VAGAASALDVPFHANIGILDECSGDILSALTRQRSFHSIVNLQGVINTYRDERNAEPRPFV
jgi:hypothetical protein